MYAFILADIGEGMTEGEIVRWLVEEGDTVGVDQPLLELQTDKVTAELPSPVAGTIAKRMFHEGATVPVGATLVEIMDGSDEHFAPLVSSDAKRPQQLIHHSTEAAAPEAIVSGAQQTATNVPSTSRSRSLATPHVRYFAREMNVDIEQVTGTGRKGRVTEEDVRLFAQRLTASADAFQASGHQVHAMTIDTPSGKRTEAQGAPLSLTEERIAMKGIRKKTAEHMVNSVRIIPHVTHVDDLDIGELQTLRERLRKHADERDIKLTYLAFFVKAVVLSLKAFPTLNASVDDETNEMVLKHYYNIGIAVDTPTGLVVPVIKHADTLSILDIANEIATLSLAAREGTLSLDQIRGGTFTISNVGSIGGLYATPIINHPEVAILGLHKIEKRVVVRNDEAVIRPMMNMSLSFDHRIIDGATAVRFTNRIKALLEEPDRLWVELA